MRNYLETDYQKLLHRQAERLGIPVEDLCAERDVVSSHSSAAERLGFERDISGAKLLANVFQLSRADMTTNEACLRPRHVEAVLATGKVPSELKTHFDECASCQALVRAARVRTNREQEFVGQICRVSDAPTEHLASAGRHALRPRGVKETAIRFRAEKVNHRLRRGGALQGIKRKDAMKVIKSLVRMGVVTPDGQLTRDSKFPSSRELVTRIVAESRIPTSVATAVVEAMGPAKRLKQRARAAFAGTRGARMLGSRKIGA